MLLQNVEVKASGQLTIYPPFSIDGGQLDVGESADWEENSCEEVGDLQKYSNTASTPSTITKK